MSQNAVPLDELAAAVQHAVQQVLGKQAAIPIDKVWVGFVAPDNLATPEIAGKVAAELGREAGVNATGSVAQQLAVPSAGQAQQQLVKPGHIIGLIFNPQVPR